jgi:hypothetical protein
MPTTTPETATYSRPVKAKLIVRTEHDEEWEATPEDLLKFGYAKKMDMYISTCDMLTQALGPEGDIELSPANDVRYMIECALMYSHSPWARADGTPWPDGEDQETGDRVRAAIKKALTPVTPVEY